MANVCYFALAITENNLPKNIVSEVALCDICLATKLLLKIFLFNYFCEPVHISCRFPEALEMQFPEMKSIK